MPYEQGMDIQFDRLTGVVTVHFRGEKTVLPGKYENRELGMKAGEKYCLKLGWEKSD